MDPLREAIGKALATDAPLQALLGAPGEVHHAKAPSKAKYPYVVFNRQAGTNVWAMGPKPAFRDDLWLVKGVCRDLDAGSAEDIDARCEEVLNDAALEVAGHRHLFCLRESDMPTYSEADSGEAIYHCGGLYRIKEEPL